MRVLVTAASRHGSTADIATRIAEELRGRGLTVDHLAPADVGDDLTAYDGVVIGSALYEGRWLKAARNLVARRTEQLAAPLVWLFSSGPVGDPPRPTGDPDVSDLVLRSAALEHRLFAGRLDVDRLGPVERTLVRVVHSSEGDFRDWQAISAWASQIADTLATTPPAVDRRLARE